MQQLLFSKKFPSTTDILPDVESFVIESAKKFGLTGNKLDGFALAASEAASNSIVHGNKHDISKKIIIELLKENSSIELRISDEGKGFNPSEIPDPTAPENILKDSGRGIFIMKSFLTDLRYKFSSDGTTTILVLNL